MFIAEHQYRFRLEVNGRDYGKTSRISGEKAADHLAAFETIPGVRIRTHDLGKVDSVDRYLRICAWSKRRYARALEIKKINRIEEAASAAYMEEVAQ